MAAAPCVPTATHVLLRDGGGIHSDGDWFTPRDADLAGSLRKVWWQRVQDWKLVDRLHEHVRSRVCHPLLSDEEVAVLRADLSFFLKSKDVAHTTEVPTGQPLCLQLIQGCLELWKDIDTELPALLSKGVPTGVLETIPCSGVWRPTEVSERPQVDLQVWEEPWGSGSKNPQLLEELVQADVSDGFAEWVQGGRAELEQRFGSAWAAGKLGIVQKEGAAPRLIGDSSISNANSQCRIQERVELPNLSSVASFVSRYPAGQWSAFSLDFSKAHKRIKVRPSEQGLSAFCLTGRAGQRRWVVYKTCHFGAAWAAYWWSRLAAAFVRIGHRVLHHPHFLCIYVDDTLALFPRRVAGEMSCLLICLACTFGFPISWHKLDLGPCLKWIGWSLIFEGAPRAELPQEKVTALLDALRLIIFKPRAVARQSLQTLVGRLVWYTSGAYWLKPWLQTLFHALNKPKLRFLGLDPIQLEELAEILTARNILRQDCRTCDAQAGWHVLEAGGQVVRGQSDLLTARQKHGRVWVKFGEPSPDKISLSQEELGVVCFFEQVLRIQEPIQLVESAGPSSVAAADAFAEGEHWGIGGWILPPDAAMDIHNIWWFSVQLDRTALPAWFLKGPSDLQGRIAALEALAQLVLLESQEQVVGTGGTARWVSLRQWCDNAGVVATSQKGLSMKQPLAGVLQSLTLLAARYKVNLRIAHVAGVRNDWADGLSRGRLPPGLDKRKRLSPDWLNLLNLAHARLAEVPSTEKR